MIEFMGCWFLVSLVTGIVFGRLCQYGMGG